MMTRVTRVYVSLCFGIGGLVCSLSSYGTAAPQTPLNFSHVFVNLSSSEVGLLRASDRKNAQDFCIRKMIEGLGTKIRIWAVDAQLERTAGESGGFQIACQASYFQSALVMSQSLLTYLERKLDYVPLFDEGDRLGRVIPKTTRLIGEPYLRIELGSMEPGKTFVFSSSHRVPQATSLQTPPTRQELIGFQSSLSNFTQFKVTPAKSGRAQEVSIPIVAYGIFDTPVYLLWNRKKILPLRGTLTLSQEDNTPISLKLNSDPVLDFPTQDFALHPVAKEMKFPDSFKWGVATAGHQIEGGNVHSDWHAFEQRHGTILNNDKSDNGPDHWNRIEEDLHLLLKMGIKQYRMSVEWSRIEPEENRFNQDASVHYRKEIQLLLKNGIEPIITLQHSTFPFWVQERGGWEWDGIPEAFARFSGYVFTQIAPEVRNWVTVNEPFLYLLGGYIRGSVPPAKMTGFLSLKKPLVGLLRSHAFAYRKLKSLEKKVRPEHALPIRIGMAHRMDIFVPQDHTSYLDSMITKAANESFNWSIPNAIKTGKLNINVPLIGSLGIDIPEVKDTQDYYGVNYYTRMALQFQWPQINVKEGVFGSTADLTEMGWEMYPEGLYQTLDSIHKNFPKLPILILENGIADGMDRYRVKYLHDHLVYLHYAIEKGIPVENFCYWSLYDNFEWAEGYSIRVGLYSVDYKSKKRTPRPSAEYFSQIIRNNSVPLQIKSR